MMSDEGKETEQDNLSVINPLVIVHGKSSTRNSVNYNRKYVVYFSEERHNDMVVDPSQRAKVAKWRMKDRMKTISVALVLCLNLGVDPPDVIKTYPCARMETWLDPTQMQSQKALELIGKRVQEQYERWQARARYKQCLDPTVEEVKKLCLSIRRNAKDERVLFHYNGHGVPRPTANGEIWVFNKGFTQYIPLSIYDLQTWVGSPSIYVFDCSSAGTILNWFNQFAEQREKEMERMASAAGSNTGTTTPTQPLLRDCILLAACGPNEILPMSPEYPADMFTSCLTTPIKMALRWFCTHTILTGITMDMIDKIPGHLNSRRTPLGELNWIFTAVTDTIAWNVLPRELFQKLFRQDLLVASLFRNFLLAERIMRGANCTPVSSPLLPPTYMHPMWQAWDLAVDICLSQFPAMLANPNLEFKHSPFFTEQLTAFEVWLESGNEHKSPPEQLPIVLQVLLSQVHRLRALVLLGRFLDLGPWAVNLALSVGIFPYVLKLLQSAAADLRQILIFIWAKILALDKACQLDLVKDNGHHYFIGVLSTPNVPSDQRSMATFVLTVIVNNSRPGQSACLSGGLLSICLQQTADPDPIVRRWMVICLAKLWENFEEAKTAAIREGAHEKLCAMLQDVEPEVRAAAVYALGTFVGGAEGNEQRTNIELNIGLTLPLVTADSSPLVRRELVIALSHLVVEYDEKFKAVAHEFAHEERLRVLREAQQEEERRKKDSKSRSKKDVMTSSEPIPINTGQFSAQLGSVYGLLWKLIIQLCSDPHPEVASLANEVARSVTVQIEQDSLVSSYMQFGTHNKRNIISSSGSIMRPSPKKASSSIASLARSKLGHQRSGSNTSASTAQSHASVHDGTNVTLAGGTTNITNAIIHDYNGNNSSGSNNTTGGGGPNGNSGRRFSTLDLGYGGGFGDDYLMSSYYEWGANFYSRPIIVEPEDPNSPSAVEQRWRAQRNDRILHESWELNSPTFNCKTDTQISILDNETEEASVLQFHPFENTMVVADNADSISVWNWEAGQKLHVFSNNNPLSSRITTVKIINEYDRGLLLVGSNDGIIRIWNGMESAETLRLVSAWRAIPEAPPSHNSTTMVVEWQQDQGRLLVAGDVGFVRVWDAERELSVQDIPTECPVGVTSISSNNNSGGKVFVTGYQDGSVRLFDMRVQNKYSQVATYTDHKSWIIGVAMPRVRDNMIVTCGTTGEIKFWTAGYNTPTMGVSTNDATSALAVHDFAPVLACGSQTQKIRVINFSGEELSMIRYHDGFLGQRIGPVSCLNFHPYKMYLAAGATDSIVSIYTNDTGRTSNKQLL